MLLVLLFYSILFDYVMYVALCFALCCVCLCNACVLFFRSSPFALSRKKWCNTNDNIWFPKKRALLCFEVVKHVHSFLSYWWTCQDIRQMLKKWMYLVSFTRREQQWLSRMHMDAYSKRLIYLGLLSNHIIITYEVFLISKSK